MGVLIDKFISDYKYIPSGSKGWNISHIHQGLRCPECGNEDPTRLTVGIKKEKGLYTFQCVKCKCTMSLEKYLYKMHLYQYLTKYKPITKQIILEKKFLTKQEEKKEEKQELDIASLPILFKRLKYSPYLMKRGAKKEIFEKWIIGKTDFEEKYKGYIIFGITENNKIVGFVARCKKSKEEIDNYNKTHDRKILRWRNSENDFSQIVFGLDEITEQTKLLVVVEGITSKMRIDCELETWNQEQIKVVCTFGKKTSKEQLEKIKNKCQNIEKIILFYDSDAISSAKKTSYQYKELFENVWIAFCQFKDKKGNYKDAGDLNKEELLETLNNLESPFEFFSHKIQKKSLFKKGG